MFHRVATIPPIKQNIKPMAIRKVSEGVSGWTNKMPFPQDRYSICCIEEEFVMSKSKNNPQLVRTWEIISPPIVQMGDKSISVAGLKITEYQPTKVHNEDGDGWNTEASDKAFGRFRDGLLLAGFDPNGEIDDENPPLFMKGKTLDAIVTATKEVACKPPTPEQLRKGQRKGDPIKDGEGNEVNSYQLKIGQMLGLSQTKVNVAY